MKKYDYLIIGSGLFGSTFAQLAAKDGSKCLVIDKRGHTGGNIVCQKINGINVHKYGAHIFHTSNKEVWDFVNRFVPFNNYRHSVLAKFKNEVFNLPFNMNTFYQLWGVITPEEAREKIIEQRTKSDINEPKNLEEQAIYLVGYDIYEKLIKGYTEKQWGRSPKELPSFIINRLPIRFIFDNNYYNDLYQGIPVGGYNRLIEGLLAGCKVQVNANFFHNRAELETIARNIIYTGRIDEYFDFKNGKLEYRSLHFENEILQSENFQGCPVVNYTEKEIPFTRIIEHKHFEFGTQPSTVITREYPVRWEEGKEIFYPINNDYNNALYQKYRELADNEPNTYFGGRLADYAYYDMDQVIEKAIELYQKVSNHTNKI